MWRRLERLVRPPLPGTCAEPLQPNPNRNTTTTWRSWAVPWRYEARPTACAHEESHQDLSEADSAGRILRRVASVRSRGAADPDADATHRACDVPTATDERRTLCGRSC